LSVCIRGLIETSPRCQELQALLNVAEDRQK
jgi:hypothetical protein